MIYRKIQKSDYDQINELWQSIDGLGISESDSEENITQFIENNPHLNYLCENKESVLGTILCGNDGRRGYIYHVAVRKDFQGKGIGKKLTDIALSKLQEQGIKKCHLFVYVDNEKGINFWNANGWEKREDLHLFSKNI